ncbi:MAG: prenyltransferase/squalene oxidase repeat-containing protein, partial [Acutalibacteraceae bacterium]
LSADNVDGVDLSKQLLNEQNIMGDGLYGAIYGKFALYHIKSDDSEKLDAAKDNMTSLILQNQNDDGSFSLTYGDKPDVGITALALAALSDEQNKAEVSSAVDKALLWLINAQNRDGSFSDTNGNPDCVATARVIIALRALGIKTDDERFVREQNTYDALLSFFNGTAFSADFGGSSSAEATEAALLALFSYNHSSNPFTLTVNSHLEQLNLWLFGIIAAVLLVTLGILLFVMKKKGFFSSTASENRDNSRKGDNPPNV